MPLPTPLGLPSVSCLTPRLQAVVAACPRPRNGVHSASTARLANEAQKAPGLVLHELRGMAASSLIGFELSSEEGPAYEVRPPARALARAACH